MRLFSILVFSLISLSLNAQVLINSYSQGLATPDQFSPVFWHDFSNPDDYTSLSADDNSGIIVDGGTAKTGQTISNFDGTITRKPSFNGEATYFNKSTNLKTGVAGDYNFLHNGNAFDIELVWKQITPTAATNEVIMANSTAAAASRGFAVLVSNTSGKTNALEFYISNGTAFILSFSANNAITSEAYNRVRFRFDGTTFRAFVNGVQVGADATLSGVPSASNSAGALTFGSPSSGAARSQIYLKHVVIFNRVLTSDEVTQLNSWATTEAARVVTVTDANVYIIWGQSNAGGRGLNSAIAADLTGELECKILNTQTSRDNRANWEFLQVTRNQTMETPATYHGPEMRFGKSMGSNCFIIKEAEGSTRIDTDWQGTKLTQLRTQLTTAIPEMLHVLRKNFVLRGIIGYQGEGNTGSGLSTGYKQYYYDFLNAVIDHISVTNGITVNKCRIVVTRIHASLSYSGMNSTDKANVRTDQAAIVSNYLTDNPSRVSQVLGLSLVDVDDLPLDTDNTHYTAPQYNTIGTRGYNSLSAYVNE
jgi:hypothetical protein